MSSAGTEPTSSSFLKRWGFALQVVILVLAGWWTFSPTLLGEWQWDDSAYLTENPNMQDPAGLRKIWLEPGSFIEYYPIEASVQWLQWQRWHEVTFGYHATNILLHLLSALLVWRLLGKLGLRFAWWGALIFALHPMTVESVAWISELKNMLSLPPFLLAMGTYLDYEKNGRRLDYLLAVGFFLIAMLCKISMALFPVVILLHAWWKRDKISWDDLKKSAPFFVISLVLGVTALMVSSRYEQLHGLVSEAHLGGFFSRLACAGLVLSFYCFKCFWPVGLMAIYPQWNVDPPSLLQFLPWPILGGLFYWSWKKRRSWGRHVLLGFGFFAINLAPFLGFKSISYMSFTWVMDHLVYLPMLGLIGLATAGAGCLAERLDGWLRAGAIGFLAVIVVVMAGQSHQYAKIFQDEATLWTYVLQRNPQAWPAYNNLGNALLQSGRAAQAEQLYVHALEIHPASAVIHNNMGVALQQMGQIPEALENYREALRLAPRYLDAQQNLARLESAQKAVK